MGNKATKMIVYRNGAWTWAFVARNAYPSASVDCEPLFSTCFSRASNLVIEHDTSILGAASFEQTWLGAIYIN